MTPLRRSIALAVATLPLALAQVGTATAAPVRAADHTAFWLWGGVKPPPEAARAERLYILQGQVAERKRPDGPETALVAQGMNVARLKRGAVWLVYRVDTLNWPPEIMQAIVARLGLWRGSGNPVVGLQIDFDARTRHLKEYAAFLRQVRARLPQDYRLGITGLLDWGSTGDVAAINRLQGVVDEIAIQTYQGRRTIAGYRAYLPALRHLTLPFRIGLVQNGEWQAPEGLEANPWFRGYVVFLQNQDRR